MCSAPTSVCPSDQTEWTCSQRYHSMLSECKYLSSRVVVPPASSFGTNRYRRLQSFRVELPCVIPEHLGHCSAEAERNWNTHTETHTQTQLEHV